MKADLKLIFTLAVIFTAAFSVLAQQPKAPKQQNKKASVKKETVSFDIGGLQLGKRTSQENIIKAFAASPENYISWELDEGLGEEYTFNGGKDIVKFEGRRGLVFFSVSSNKISALGGLIKVGDNIGNLFKIPSVEIRDRSETEYEIIPEDNDSFEIFIKHEGGTITNIKATVWE